MVNLKNRVTDNIQAIVSRLIKFEICEVDKIHWHKNANDKNFNTSDIVIRDRRQIEDEDFRYVRERVPTLQEPSGKWSGHPVNPRRGNLVKTLFYKLRKALILSNVDSKWEPPVCRPDPYTERNKLTQYRPLSQDKNKDFPTAFPNPRKPVCENWQHGPCNGDKTDDEKEPCIGRDYWHVFDYCQEGDRQPSCENCTSIDYCKRCKNTWLKCYSANTMSCQSPNRRIELHTYCGSNLRFENESGQSEIYSEGQSHIQLKNAVSESDPRAQLNLQGKDVSGEAGVGTWDLHTHTEDKPIASEGEGVRFAGIRPDDNQVNWAWELINFPTKSFVRCYKDGDIEINSCNGASVITIDGTTNKITIDGTREILLKASEKITADTPLFVHTGLVTAPDCHHDACTCPCCQQ
jgi:hypothetical protein